MGAVLGPPRFFGSHRLHGNRGTRMMLGAPACPQRLGGPPLLSDLAQSVSRAALSGRLQMKPESLSPSMGTFVFLHFFFSFSAAVKCSELPIVEPLLVNCSNPWGQFSYGSTCTFHCPEGQPLNGSARTACRHTGQWSAAVPTCQGEVVLRFRTPRRCGEEQNLCFFFVCFCGSHFLSLGFPCT